MLESGASPGPTQCSKTDYAINCGTINADELTSGQASNTSAITTLAQGDACTTWVADNGWNGVCHIRSDLTARIFDGMSNTILIGEKEIDPNHYTDGSTACDNHCILAGLDNDIYRQGITAPIQDTPGNASENQFGAAHSGSCNFVFCDGSVKSIRYAIDTQTFANLCCRNDQQPIDESRF